mmetsp:Transcript_35480/g.81191  ORF Transcript_35480/g.81191 Transcript_35480/m.81191 type:complete len:205 (+) Transcript_35480:187-801(+)
MSIPFSSTAVTPREAFSIIHVTSNAPKRRSARCASSPTRARMLEWSSNSARRTKTPRLAIVSERGRRGGEGEGEGEGREGQGQGPREGGGGVGPLHKAWPARAKRQDQVAGADLPLLPPDQGVPDHRFLHEGQAEGRGHADHVRAEANLCRTAHPLRLLRRRGRLRRAHRPRREGGEGGAHGDPGRHPRRQVRPHPHPARLLGR